MYVVGAKQIRYLNYPEFTWIDIPKDEQEMVYLSSYNSNIRHFSIFDNARYFNTIDDARNYVINLINHCGRVENIDAFIDPNTLCIQEVKLNTIMQLKF